MRKASHEEQGVTNNKIISSRGRSKGRPLIPSIVIVYMPKAVISTALPMGYIIAEILETFYGTHRSSPTPEVALTREALIAMYDMGMQYSSEVSVMYWSLQGKIATTIRQKEKALHEEAVHTAKLKRTAKSLARKSASKKATRVRNDDRDSKRAAY